MNITCSSMFIPVMILCFAGCHRSAPKWPQSTFTDRSYVDLQPGWRLKVVVPVIESGGYKVRTEGIHNNDGTVSLRMEPGLLGYETDYFEVNAAGGVNPPVSFTLAEFTSIDHKKTTKPKPVISLFSLPDNLGYARLLFLTRVSENDHDQAILAASSLATLDALTSKVESNPSPHCTTQPESVCLWIPEGIAVQPEKRDPKNNKVWIPAL